VEEALPGIALLRISAPLIRGADIRNPSPPGCGGLADHGVFSYLVPANSLTVVRVAR